MLSEISEDERIELAIDTINTLQKLVIKLQHELVEKNKKIRSLEADIKIAEEHIERLMYNKEE